MSNPTQQPVPMIEGGLLHAIKRGLHEIRRCLSWRLVLLLIGSLVILLGATSWLALKLHRQHLLSLLEENAIGIGETILYGAQHEMLENDRDDIAMMVRNIGGREDVLALRLMNCRGEITYSDRPEEIGGIVNIKAPMCASCHTEQGIRRPKNLREGLQLYSVLPGEGALGLCVPVMNTPTCSNAPCHVHPEEQRVLGMLDLELATTPLEAAMRDAGRQMTVFALITILGISAIVGALAWRVVHRPISALLTGTRRVGGGDLAYRIHGISHSSGELGELAESFNEMSSRLQQAQDDLAEWNRLLESKVDEKTRQLEQTRDQMIFAQKMASLGKLAAVVAHEINNPLAGILVYTKLVRRQLGKLRKSISGEKEKGEYEDLEDKLSTVETSVADCGEVVRNLLLFSRHSDRKRARTNINKVVASSLKLVQHQAELSGTSTDLDLVPELPEVMCETAQIQQAVVAAIMNGLEAMPNGGSLVLKTSYDAKKDEVSIDIADTGVGIPEELRTKVFEPFFTTKEEGKGTGLGLSVMYGIIHQHHGKIDVYSTPGKGTTFSLHLPVNPPEEDADDHSPLTPLEEEYDS